jgi:RNA polymerase sigma-70 factor (ECF subfamily)
MPGALLVDEKELIERYLSDRTGDTFEALFQTFCPRLVVYFRARGCDVGVAEDLAQNVMLNVYRHAAEVRDTSLFRAWMLRIAHNELVRHWERSGRQVKTVDLDACAGAVARQLSAPGHWNGVEFAESMAELVPQERQVILLRYVEQLEFREIATVLDIPVGTAQWRTFMARRKLARYFGRRVV